MSLRDRLRGALVHPRLPWGLALAALLVHAASLGAGYLVDDHMHRSFARGETIPGGPRGVWEMYRFADGGAGVRAAIDAGLHTWWTSRTLKLAFLRPIPSLVRFAEEKAFGDHAVFPHLVSVVVFVATVLVLHAAYRRWIGGAAAGLAALLFAVDDAHATTVTWIAARHSLLATLGVAASLALHLRARDARRVSYASGLFLLLGLLSSEATLSALPVFAAVAAVSDPRPARARLVALAPIGAAVATWAVLYAALGCGASSSGYYVDPAEAPGRFARAAALRLPALASAQLLVPPSELASMQPAIAGGLAVLGVLVLAGAGLLAWRSRARRLALALHLAFVVSLLPACGTNADDRLLMIPGIAAFPLVALLCRDGGRVLAGLVVAVHVVLAVVLAPVRSLFFARSMGAFVAHGAATLYGLEGAAGRDIVLVTTPDGLLPTSMYLSRRNAGLPVARSTRILVTAPGGEVTLTREDAETISVTATGGMMRDPFIGAVRDRPFHEGERSTTPALDVTVAEVGEDGAPRRIVFRLRGPLERPDLAFVRWGPDGYAPFSLPPPGASMGLPAIDFADALATRSK